MNKKLVIAFIIIIVLGISWLALRGSLQQKLTGPAPTPASPQSGEAGPKTFKFDASTDLKTELEKVNPQVLDSDFNE